MVKGLEAFRERFRNFANHYVLIGGAACDLIMTGTGLPFRATKDPDIVLYLEALDAAFVRAFWEFVRDGGYETQERSNGEKQFYRFQKPTNEPRAIPPKHSTHKSARCPRRASLLGRAFFEHSTLL